MSEPRGPKLEEAVTRLGEAEELQSRELLFNETELESIRGDSWN